MSKFLRTVGRASRSTSICRVLDLWRQGFARLGRRYLEAGEELVEDVFDSVGDGPLVGGDEVADAGDDCFENLGLVVFLEAELNVLPEIIDDPSVVGVEVGQGRDHIVAVSLHVSFLRVVVDDQLIESRKLVDSDGSSGFSDGHQADLCQRVKS